MSLSHIVCTHFDQTESCESDLKTNECEFDKKDILTPISLCSPSRGLKRKMTAASKPRKIQKKTPKSTPGTFAKRKAEFKQKMRFEAHCPQCGFIAYSDDKMAEHLRSHLIKDRCCGETFARQRELIHHYVQKHNMKKPYHCKSCSSTFGRDDKAKVHLKNAQPISISIFHCLVIYSSLFTLFIPVFLSYVDTVKCQGDSMQQSTLRIDWLSVSCIHHCPMGKEFPNADAIPVTSNPLYHILLI